MNPTVGLLVKSSSRLPVFLTNKFGELHSESLWRMQGRRILTKR
jgi:hypothetical protein